ncbi:hypothetical protein Slin15195_G122580 [Septoria linicola]|uniref:F-box domain-containing protein n=1 Tax=Septoria linicola TaxID=215465 RepID=A0A9Q9B0X2_9PEZI|nr:hypothetical protein Slin14017_G078780 [Septoria linicola]USW58939.1 hypothetical protein Slin15195_G122580 [Septoria linicola]
MEQTLRKMKPASSSESCQRAGFFNLPPELRNCIYRLTLRDVECITGMSLPFRFENGCLKFVHYWRRFALRTPAGLLRASRQAHAEFTPMLYSEMEFDFFTIDAARAWAEQVGGSIVHLRRVVLRYSDIPFANVIDIVATDLAATWLPALDAIMSSSPPETKPLKTFLDLPAEIRNQIYELALVHSRTIHIFGPSGHDRIVIVANRVTDRWGAPPSKPEIAIGTLLVSRQVHLESAPILYGANGFDMEDIGTAARWSTEIGKSIRYLTRIALTGNLHNPRDVATRRSWLASLEQASELRSLGLDDCSSRRDANMTARVLLPLFRSIKKARRESGSVFALAKILHFTEPGWARFYTPLFPFDSRYSDLATDILKIRLREPEEEAACEVEVWQAVIRTLEGDLLNANEEPQ